MFNITDLYHKMVNNPDLSGHFGLLTHWHPDDEEYTKKNSHFPIARRGGRVARKATIEKE